MELDFLLIKLSFSTAGSLTDPLALVRIKAREDDPNRYSAAGINIEIELRDVVPAGADLPAIASAALQQARQLVDQPAVTAYLARIRAREQAEDAARQQESAEALDRILGG